MPRLKEKLKELKKKPKSVKQNLSFLILVLIVPIIIFFWFIGLKSNLERVSLSGEQEFFGEKIIELIKLFFSYVSQGFVLLYSRLTELISRVDWLSFLKNLGRLILGKPRVEFLEPGQPIDLPISS
ncbi:MAG: hypothetical protein AB1721_01895 [Patescibacteria group bacterium]